MNRLVIVSSKPRRFQQIVLGAALMLAAITLAPSLFAQEPMLVPQPRELKAVGTPLAVTSQLQIVLPAPVAPEDSFAAESLARELKLDSGLDVPIVAVAQVPLDKPVIVLGRLDQPAIEGLLLAQRVKSSDIGDQGYALFVTDKLAVIGGKDAAGLYYGVQTLRQLIVGEGSDARILSVQVRDWPSLQYRGTQVDMARGPVPKLKYLKRIVRTISEFKMNQLYMYIEDSFRLDGQPLIGVLSDTLTRSEWTELVSYAARYHVEIVPATEACGHLHKIMRFEEYSGFDERPHGAVIAPGDPNGIAFLNDLYSQMAAVFPTPLYNVGCDETFELGLGRSKDLVAQKGYGQVYVDSLKAVEEVVKKYNKQVMFWGDIAVEHPEMIPSLPRDLIVASWEYGYHASYDKWVKPFQGTGMRLFVCPWIANTNVIVPDDEEAAANIAGFLDDGRKAGAIGTDVTVWNDHGEMLYGLNWWGIVYGAASAWEPQRVDVDAFNQKYDWVFYRNTDHRFANAIRELSHLNEVLREGDLSAGLKEDRWGGAFDATFWLNPFTPAGAAMVQKELPVASYVRTSAEHAYTVLVNSAGLARRNADTLDDYKFAALRLDDLGMRIQFAQEISNEYADALAHQNDHGPNNPTGDDLSNISGTNGRLQDLRDYTTRLRELYKGLYQREYLTDWMPNMLQLYDHDSMTWQSLIARFSSEISHRAEGEQLPPAEAFGFLPPTPANGSAAPSTNP
jgi:hexosaminidase